METVQNTSGQTRRDFLKTSALGAVVAGGLGIAGITSGCAGQGQSDDVFEQRYTCDIVIAGAGVGGLASALTAVQGGASVILVEASKMVGGTSRFSAGSIGLRFGTTWEETQANAPLSNPVLSKTVLDNWPEYKQWIIDSNLPLGEVTEFPGEYLWMGGKLPEPALMKADSDAYFQAFGKMFNDAGGTTLTSTFAKKLITNERDEIVGLRCEDENGTFDIGAKAVIIATGGFQCNKEMVTKYIAPQADLSHAQCVPYLDGAGIRMAEEIGAKLSSGLSTYYGHHEPWPWQAAIDATDPEKYEAMNVDDIHCYYYGATTYSFQTRGLITNIDGKRYVDESKQSFLVNQYTMKQPYARAYVFIDQAMRDQFTGTRKGTGLTGEDRIEYLIANGAPVLIADTLEELADMLVESTTSEDKFNKHNFLKTVDEFNAAVESGTADCLDVPKLNYADKLSTPPFYAFPVVAGIMGTFGGICINEKAEVIGNGGGIIKGLYAVPGAAGGIMNVEYWCVISGHSVFGRIAAKSALDFASSAEG